MINGLKVIALVPARSGSKRLPEKNTLNLNGKPLIGWTLEAARQSTYIDRVIVSTDCDNIIRVSKAFNAEVPFIRPKELATDHASTSDVILHAIELLALCEKDVVAVLQPTSPLRTKKSIDAAIELLYEKNANAVVSVCKCAHSPLWSNTLTDDQNMAGFIRQEVKGKRSQELPDYYQLNGAIYVAKVDYLRRNRGFNYDDNVYAYVMNRYESVDIDEEMDFLLAETMLTSNKS